MPETSRPLLFLKRSFLHINGYSHHALGYHLFARLPRVSNSRKRRVKKRTGRLGSLCAAGISGSALRILPCPTPVVWGIGAKCSPKRRRGAWSTYCRAASWSGCPPSGTRRRWWNRWRWRHSTGFSEACEPDSVRPRPAPPGASPVLRPIDRAIFASTSKRMIGARIA
jgi:hypothetical protein